MSPEIELPAEGSFSFPLDKGLGNGALISPYLGNRSLGLYNYVEIKDQQSVDMGGAVDISLQIAKNSYFINALIRDLDDNIVVQIVNNNWRIYKNAVSKYNFDDKGFEVFDNTGRIVMSFDFRKDNKSGNITTLFIQGFTQYPDGSVGFFPSTNFFDHIKLEDPSHAAMRQFYDKSPIEPLFKYFGPDWQHVRL